MDIKDLIGLSEPLKRLIDVISKGIGAVSTPYLVRKNADAKAYEIETISRALKQANADLQIPVVYKDGEIQTWITNEDRTLKLETGELEERTGSRTDYQERRRQVNIEDVTAIAAGELVDETEVPSSTPDEDWISRFFSAAQDVSSDDVQVLWGRILAGEIKKPGSYSLRTLDFLRNLSKGEAEILERVGKLTLFAANSYLVPAFDSSALETNWNVRKTDQILLAELGIIFPNDLSLTSFSRPELNEIALVGQDDLLLVKRGQIESELNMHAWKFTGVGTDLISLIDRPTDETYLEWVGSWYTEKKGEAYLAKITKRDEEGTSYEITRKISGEQDDAG